ncbi:hypothetical protein U1872_18545 [Sphingomonas sp. RB3P16]|uniref:hypothetical protein n=1 Tax=Parasphingomonas frigoris TaxID=3096163 RepID=UPI002FC933E6
MNDNDPPLQGAAPKSDPYGQAALLLVESLIHGLCETSTLSADQAIEITQRAVEVQFDHAEAADGSGAAMWRSHDLLVAILASLKIDDGGPPTSPRLV